MDDLDLLDLLARAGVGYERRVATVPVDQWSESSSCEGWTLKDLADHVVGSNRFAVVLLAGGDSDEAFHIALEPGFDGDPVTQFRESADAQQAAFAEPGALSRTVKHPAGTIPATTYLAYRLGDLVLHGWDLARSTGGDEALDDELLPPVWDAYLAAVDAPPHLRPFGDGPSGRVPDDAPLAQRLLDLSGRRP
jgi:uncharacterized protein (TIGR03086 family)